MAGAGNCSPFCAKAWLGFDSMPVRVIFVVDSCTGTSPSVCIMPPHLPAHFSSPNLDAVLSLDLTASLLNYEIIFYALALNLSPWLYFTSDVLSKLFFNVQKYIFTAFYVTNHYTIVINMEVNLLKPNDIYIYIYIYVVPQR